MAAPKAKYIEVPVIRIMVIASGDVLFCIRRDVMDVQSKEAREK
jgi:hypothetical protein